MLISWGAGPLSAPRSMACNLARSARAGESESCQAGGARRMMAYGALWMSRWQRAPRPW